MLARDDIDIVINLTIPVAHAEVSLRIIEAGKHAYCEKPLAVNRADGARVVSAAQSAGLRIGCAPDTFLGGGGQTARKVIDEGLIGKPVAATAFWLSRGHERWHPNAGFYYLKGGGPHFDMGPYYLTALVNLMGGWRACPARRSGHSPNASPPAKRLRDRSCRSRSIPMSPERSNLKAAPSARSS